MSNNVGIFYNGTTDLSQRSHASRYPLLNRLLHSSSNDSQELKELGSRISQALIIITPRRLDLHSREGEMEELEGRVEGEKIGSVR